MNSDQPTNPGHDQGSSPPPDSGFSRRRFLTTVGGSIVVIGIAASVGEANASSARKTLDPVTARAQGSEEQKIHVFDYDPTGIEAWVAADEGFDAYFSEQHPNISVDKTQAGFVGYSESLLTAIAGGEKFDVIYGWTPWLQQFIDNDVVQELDSFLSGSDTDSPEQFFDHGKDVVDGKLYGLAWFATGYFMYYNRGKIADAGLEDPADLDARGEWTYEQMLAHSIALSEPGDAPMFGFDMAITRGPGDFAAFSKGWGSDLWAPDYAESLLDTPENIALWDWIQGYYRDRLTPTPTEGGGLAESVSFADERVRMMISGTNYLRQADQLGVPDRVDIGMSRIPKGPGGQSHVAYVNSYFMGSRGDNAAGGWEWYRERTFSDTARDLYVDTGAGRFPVRRDQDPVTRYDWEQPDLYGLISEDMFPAPIAAPEQTRFSELYGAAWDRLILQDAGAEELLLELAAEADKLVS